MHPPLFYAWTMKVLLTGFAILQLLVNLAHLSETYHTIFVILQIYSLAWLFFTLDSGFESIIKILVQFVESRLWNFCLVCESLENLFVLCDLSDYEVDMFAGFPLWPEIETWADHLTCNFGGVDSASCTDYSEDPALGLASLGIEKEDSLLTASVYPLELSDWLHPIWNMTAWLNSALHMRTTELWWNGVTAFDHQFGFWFSCWFRYG